MPRFITNRWWTFILALVLSVGSIAMLSHHASADACTGAFGTFDGTGSGSAPPPGNGDPDVPTGKTVVKRGALTGSGSSYTMHTVGDGRVVDSALMWRLQLVMRVLRGIYLRG